jgi:hypothetical protein
MRWMTSRAIAACPYLQHGAYQTGVAEWCGRGWGEWLSLNSYKQVTERLRYTLRTHSQRPLPASGLTEVAEGRGAGVLGSREGAR